jgi:predicted transcriptional regulator
LGFSAGRKEAEKMKKTLQKLQKFYDEIKADEYKDDVITISRCKNHITANIRKHNYLKVQLLLVELVLHDIKVVPSVRNIQDTIIVGKSSVNRALMTLHDEGWLIRSKGHTPRQIRYAIDSKNVSREIAVCYMRAWLQLQALSKQSKRFRKLLSHGLCQWDGSEAI